MLKPPPLGAGLGAGRDGALAAGFVAGEAVLLATNTNTSATRWHKKDPQLHFIIITDTILLLSYTGHHYSHAL